MPRTESRKACLNCRQRHLKCDREQPSCRRCRDSKVACKQSAVHSFRNTVLDGDFNRSEQRVDTLPGQDTEPSDQIQTRFVDQTRSVIEAHRRRNWAVDTESEPGQPWDAPAKPQPPELSPSATFFFNHPPSIIGLPLAADVRHVGPPSIGGSPSPLDPFLSTSPYLRGSSGSTHGGAGNLSSLYLGPSMERFHPPQSTSAATPTEPVPVITHPREAYLLKVFTQTWGPIFDCVDPDLTFTKSILHIAIHSFTPLYWAVLATSALQLSRVSNYPVSAARYYRERCSNSIMPILLQSAQPEANEETLFATYVLLRNYEHMTENLMEKDSASLFTASLAISVNPRDTVTDKMNLGRAAFWVHLRQDIHVALLLQVPINVDYPPCLQRDKILQDVENMTSGTTLLPDDVIDCAWTNKVALTLVDIINYCFQRQPRHVESWINLRGRLDHWIIGKPRRFHPYYERAADLANGRVFPDIWISCDCYVLAWLYYHTASVLLKTFLPCSDALATRAQQSKSPILNSIVNREEVLIHARAICGIATTNPNAQALIVVCHMVTVSAVFFTTADERNETIRLIRLAHTLTGHPLRDIEEKLQDAWNQQRNISDTSLQT
ncbi:hypothetical protein BDV38DRAFT_283949 [Aspergillus pseudotamarii]|uniref:Zn(2)-C6 fungal-type domain-containing protein n=1 Tax=Aspergillus pseudotamarii TaxID=132259 RepID=A0A5N6SP47_ASPPS|nr:uncharacterized protein BDV38DRAFT_283949 [Aspergillus pseudotamarii]KAE8136462.1 hypothetical protein BDV38DRAFT_283949 [Aspergillus pseudotamarii]